METDESMTKLYEASMEGSVTSLNSLIEKDRLILSKISLSTFIETPLHISALLGHTHFTQSLLALPPDLSRRVDYHGRTPLHLAAANGHVDTVRALLLHCGSDICSVKDREGKLALHYAAMRGHLSVMEILAGQEPRSISESVLHLCVRYNQLEALKLLVRSLPDSARLLNSNDNADGNTVLHLAVLLNQIETVKYLLAVPGLKQDVLNRKGLKPSEMAEHLQTDFTSLKLKLMLKDKDKDKDKDEDDQQSIAEPRAGVGPAQWLVKVVGRLRRMHGKTTRWLSSDQMRGSIAMVATLIAQTTFQTAFNPPGGVWQQTMTNDPHQQASCSDDDPCIAGTAVLANIWPPDYLAFVTYNTVSFLASVSVILMVLGGFTQTSNWCARLMTVAMLVALTFMAKTYLAGTQIVAPYNVLDPVIAMIKVCLYIWIALLSIIAAFYAVFFLAWLRNEFPLMRRRRRLLCGA